MTTISVITKERAPSDYEPLPARPSTIIRFFRETWLLVARGLRTIPRVPTRLSDVTIQPIMFTLLFLYIFGSAIHIPGISYKNFLLPGLIGQSLAFGVIGAGVATATDFGSGVIDRFRSLPVTRLSVIWSQVIGQVVEQMLGIAIVAGLGLALGWRPHHNLATILTLVGLIVLGLIAFTWFGVLMGMLLKTPDAVQGIGFSIMLPLSFLAGTFVSITTLPSWLRPIAQWDPLSPFVASMRHVSQGYNATGPWPLTHPVVAMCGWCVLIMAICVPLALRRFRTTAAAS
jgi:ABC-2 type transport system permease protein